MQSAYCQQLPYACMKRLKIDRFLMEINYLDDLFKVIYRKFLNAIDHIDYHPTSQDVPSSENREKCSTHLSNMGFYDSFECKLSPMEELFLDKLLVALENMNSTTTEMFRRMK